MTHKPVTFFDMCEMLGKGHMYVRQLLRDVELPMPDRKHGCSPSYMNVVRKLIALRCFSVSLQDIQDLLRKERRILEMLHFDSISTSPTWYLDHCNGDGYSPTQLMLTGFDLGFPIDSSAIQINLNFREQEKELFNGAEMGEDVRHALQRYLAKVQSVARTVRHEAPVLEQALCWSEEAFGDFSHGRLRARRR